QCLKRSIRRSKEFANLVGGIRTRRLAELIDAELPEKKDIRKRALKIMDKCGIKSTGTGDNSDMLIFTTRQAVYKMAEALAETVDDDIAAEIFKGIITNCVHVPDIALAGRMLETGEIKDTHVEASLQVAHAISTHEARPEIDYYVAVDDIPGEDAGAGYVDEALFSSACFYKYFSIDWEQLVTNLEGDQKLAAHTVGAYLLAATMANPSGKQNSFAAHNLPDAILVEIKENPVSYANAFVLPVSPSKDCDIVTRSIGNLADYAYDLKIGYNLSTRAFWFSPNLRHKLEPYNDEKKGESIAQTSLKCLDDLVKAVLKELDFDWEEVRQIRPVAGD
ncbi:MAG TPA: type I-E CRISPR-associated protein Cas7/Cse4/CasC, partial [Candidatus Cloacimonadota bacterium]|nr:type I-E CRISPR-associated protein Cas7/Cse4/CasC [Candidatus Cloacimonadota bacterium]